MKSSTIATRFVLLLALTVCIIGFSAFRYQEGGESATFRKEGKGGGKDTESRHSNPGIEDPKLIAELNAAIKQMQEEMKKLDNQALDTPPPVTPPAQDGANLPDGEKIRLEVMKALQAVDFEKMAADLEKSFGEMKLRIMEMEEPDMSDLKEEMKKLKETLSKEKWAVSLQAGELKENARCQSEEARSNSVAAKELTQKLHNDGLIDKDKNYSIELKEGEMYINGNKQSQEVMDKYKSYFQKDRVKIIRNRSISI